MASARTHPHIEMPSAEELGRLIEDRQPLIRQLYLDAHRLIVEAVPTIRFAVDCVDLEIGYGARQFGYDGWGMAAVTPYTSWVTVTLVKGAALDDPTGLLEGASQTMRHVKLRTPEQLEQAHDALQHLIQGAARLYES